MDAFSSRFWIDWPSQQAAAEAGQHEQDWLHERLRVAFPGGEIVRYDALNRESDFVLRWHHERLSVSRSKMKLEDVSKGASMARHHRRRFRIPAPYGWDFDGLPMRGWLAIAAAVIISAAIIWMLM